MGRKAKDDIELGKSGYWYYPTKGNGRSAMVSTGTKDETEARRIWDDIKSKDEWRSFAGGRMTWGQAWEIYLKHYYLAKATRKGLEATQTRWDHIKHIFADLEITLSTDKVKWFRDKLWQGEEVRQFPSAQATCKVHYKTIRGYIALLKTLQAYVLTASIDGKHPFPAQAAIAIAKVPMRKTDKGRASAKASLTAAQVQRVFEYVEARRKDPSVRQKGRRQHRALDGSRITFAASARLSVDERAVYMLYYAGGQRADRVAKLPWRNIDLDSRVIDFADIPGVENPDNKIGKKDMPISDELLPILRRAYDERVSDYYLDQPFNDRAFEERIRRIHLALGLPGGCHVWRKTFATHAKDVGMGDFAADAMGISEETYNAFYVQKNKDRDEAVVNSMPVKRSDQRAPLAPVPAPKKAG